jgi:hypothetical protein
MRTISAFADDLPYAVFVADSRNRELNAHKKNNRFERTSNQSYQLYYSSALVNKALIAAGYKKVPFQGRIVASITPAIIDVFVNLKIRFSCVTKGSTFIQDAIGPFCQLVALVSSVALIYFGQLPLGITALSIITLGFIDRMDILPMWIRNPIHEYSSFFGISMDLITGSIPKKIFTVILLVPFCFAKYCEFTDKPDQLHIKHITKKNTLNLDLLNKILQNTTTLEVNPHHFTLTDFTPTTPAEIKELMDLFVSINWKPHIPLIEEKFKIQQAKSDEDVASYQARIIELAKTNLQTYIDAILDKRHEFDRIHSYLKTIAYQLPKEDETTQVVSLLGLAVKGSHNGSLEQLLFEERLYWKLAIRCDLIPMNQKFLLLLQNKRTDWLLNEYLDLRFLERLRLIPVLTVYLSLYGKKLGVEIASSHHEDMASLDPLTKSLVGWYTKNIPNSFEQIYTEDSISEELFARIGTSDMLRPNLFSWLKSWIDHQEIEASTKEQLLREIDSGSLLGIPLKQNYPDSSPLNSFNKDLLKAMALDMGILQVKNS